MQGSSIPGATQDERIVGGISTSIVGEHLCEFVNVGLVRRAEAQRIQSILACAVKSKVSRHPNSYTGAVSGQAFLFSFWADLVGGAFEGAGIPA